MAVDKMRNYKHILYSTPDLERFSINGEIFGQHTVDDEQIFELVNAFLLYQGGQDSTIKELVLESFALSLVGWKSLSGALRQLFQLEKLFLCRILVTSPNGPDDGNDDYEGVQLVEGLSGMPLTCPHLEELHLVNCNINSMACQNLLRIFFTKPSNLSSHSLTPPFATLKVLSLENNSIGNVGVKCIANVLRGDRSLIALDLDRVGCSRCGITALAEGLKENDCLESLSLVGNGYADVTQPILINSDASPSDGTNKDTIQHQTKVYSCPLWSLLAKNTRLKRIRLQAGPMSSPLLRQVDFLLRLNRRGRQYLGNADVMSKIFHLMLESSSKDVDVIYYFLKSQSGIMQYRSIK